MHVHVSSTQWTQSGVCVPLYACVYNGGHGEEVLSLRGRGRNWRARAGSGSDADSALIHGILKKQSSNKMLCFSHRSCVSGAWKSVCLVRTVVILAGAGREHFDPHIQFWVALLW